MSGIHPNSSIEYDRPFSLPLGVPPHSVNISDLGKYYSELGVELGFLQLNWKKDPATRKITSEHTRDPLNGRLRSRYLLNSGGSDAVSIPTIFSSSNIPAGDMGTVNITRSILNSIGKKVWSPVMPVSGESMSTAMAKKFRWDKEERIVYAFPQPYYSDETLCLDWASSPSPTGALGDNIPGIFFDDASTHLLPTTSDLRDGELQQDLLRTPVRGLARVTRYRHIGVNLSGSTISSPMVLVPSHTCGMIINALPETSAIPSDPQAPLLRQTYIAFDNLDLQVSSEYMAGHWWLMFLRFDELDQIAQFKKAVRSSISWAIALHLALTDVTSASNNAFDGLASDVIDKLRKHTSSPNMSAIRSAIAHVLSDTNRRTLFSEFIKTTLAFIACGIGWNEIKDATGATKYPGIPAEPSARTTANKKAHALLEAAQQARNIWIPIYAGAPIGRPANRYGVHPPTSQVTEIARNGITTFDLEMLILTGRISDVFPGIQPPNIPSNPDSPLILDAYNSEITGRFASLRISDNKPGSNAFTMRDWLKQLICGWQRSKKIEAPIEYLLMEMHGHPLTSALKYSDYIKALGLRDSLDDVNTKQVAGIKYDSASTTWWSTAVGFSTGINWPLLKPGGVPEVKDASREARNAPPTRTGETVGGTLTPSGFDIEDLELVSEAREFLRSGHDTTQKVDLAIILALLDREGYRMNGRFMRQGPFDFRFRNNLNNLMSGSFKPSSLTKRGVKQGIGRVFYTLQAFGLDILDAPKLPPSGISGVNDWLVFSWENLVALITDATAVGTVQGLDLNWLNGLILSRISSRFHSVTDIGQSRILSRKVHLAGIIAQHGEFQRRQKLLRQGSAAGKLNRWWKPSAAGVELPDVPEFTALAPAFGANGEDVLRRDYLAYYALCYLSFNGSPSVWKSWVDLAIAHGAISVPKFLLYDITDAQSVDGSLVPNPIVNSRTGQRLRETWMRGHFVRFVVALDAYLRMSEAGVGDAEFPIRTGWGV